VGGALAAYLERGARTLVTFGLDAADDRIADALAALVKDGRMRRIELQRIDGEPAASATTLGEALRSAGFVEGYRGFVLRG
jgi:ATP-dependent Lhr-like helicase